jgi:hypothetical protein
MSLCSTANAGETFLLLQDTYDLPAPYGQNWYATPSDYNHSTLGDHEVFIRGVGKHGDFFGILLVSCQKPEESKWLATDGHIGSERVPSKAIETLRLKICIIRSSTGEWG